MDGKQGQNNTAAQVWTATCVRTCGEGEHSYCASQPICTALDCFSIEPTLYFEKACDGSRGFDILDTFKGDQHFDARISAHLAGFNGTYVIWHCRNWDAMLAEQCDQCKANQHSHCGVQPGMWVKNGKFNKALCYKDTQHFPLHDRCPNFNLLSADAENKVLQDPTYSGLAQRFEGIVVHYECWPGQKDMFYTKAIATEQKAVQPNGDQKTPAKKPHAEKNEKLVKESKDGEGWPYCAVNEARKTVKCLRDKTKGVVRQVQDAAKKVGKKLSPFCEELKEVMRRDVKTLTKVLQALIGELGKFQGTCLVYKCPEEELAGPVDGVKEISEG